MSNINEYSPFTVLQNQPTSGTYRPLLKRQGNAIPYAETPTPQKVQKKKQNNTHSTFQEIDRIHMDKDCFFCVFTVGSKSFGDHHNHTHQHEGDCSCQRGIIS
ncbi:MAG TPA: hypothetical protein DCE42_17165 [Myxococcales bacterium]|nr:hypothetical protein [Myxococcales bacterium]